jgi:hypothetical protein
MHDDDGVEAFVCFTSIPGGSIPQLSIAYIYTAIRSASKPRPCMQKQLSRSQLCHSFTRRCPSGSHSLVLHPALPVAPGRASTVHSISSSRSHSTESISLATSERFRRFVFAPRGHLFLCVGYRCWVQATLLARAWAVLVAGAL